MLRMHRDRWLAAVLVTAAAIGLACGQEGRDAPAGPPKVGGAITLRFQGGQERQFKVEKVEPRPDGAYLCEVKDTKTGEVITLLDRPFIVPPAPPAPSMGKSPIPSTPKLWPNDAPLPPSPAMPPYTTYTNPALTADKSPAPVAMTPQPDAPKDPPKRTFLSRLGLGSDKPPAPVEAEADANKKPGLLSRIFGPKKPTPPALPLTATGPATQSTEPLLLGPGSAMPPPVRPTPNAFPVPAPMGSSVEPPRVAPAVPSTPRSSASPLDPAYPRPPGSIESSTPPLYSEPPVARVATRPDSAPAPIALGLPSTPITRNEPSPVGAPFVQTRYSVTLNLDIQPYAKTLLTAQAPSERIFAVRALANCRDASSDPVKSLLFRSCIADPCPLVRACCIDELCNLGYYNVAFLAYLNDAATDPSDQVRASAKTALRRMTPKRGSP